MYPLTTLEKGYYYISVYGEMPLTAIPSSSPSGFISSLQSFSCLPHPLHYFLFNKYLALLVSYPTAISANCHYVYTNRLFMTYLLRLTSYHLSSHNLGSSYSEKPTICWTHIPHAFKSLLSLHRQLSLTRMYSSLSTLSI